MRQSVSAGAYARAQRFLSWNRNRYVKNADPPTHWIDQTNRFWYRRVDANGQSELVVIDARSGERCSAADYERVTEVSSSPHQLMSPNGQWTAFLKGYDLWIRSAMDGSEQALTTDGIEHHRYGSASGFRASEATAPHALWSPDSRYLVTHRLDERAVKELHLIQSAPEDGSLRPRLHTYRYPMAGDELPISQLVIFDVICGKRVEVAGGPLQCLIQTLFERQDVWWSQDARTLYFLKRERHAKSVGLYRTLVLTGMTERVLEELSDTTVYTSPSQFAPSLVRTLSTGAVIWYSQRDGWGHLYFYESDGQLGHQITQGEWVVRSIEWIDEPRQRIYFTAGGRESGRNPYYPHLYSVGFDGSQLKLLTPEDADHTWPHAPRLGLLSDTATQLQKSRFSPSGDYFLDCYSKPDLPPILVLRSSAGELIREVERADISALHEAGYTPIESFCALAADERTALYGQVFRPSDFEANKRYPVIDASYPGPQTVRSKTSFMEAHYCIAEAQSLAELGFIVITIDGRGTPFRSKAFLEHSYGQLNKASDLEDHIACIRQLAQRYPYMDLNRVGIDGFSGGGFAAAYAMLTYSDFYKVAVSAEGNQDQRSYIASWGEFYIGDIESEGYSSSATPLLAENLRGKLLLMHGELDDNVHPALTLKLVDALVKANRDFDLLLLPNGTHDAAFCSPYFIRRKWDYFVEHLMGAKPPAHYRIERSL